MSKIIWHLSRVRPNAFGGTNYGTLCNRLTTLSDGMNCTDDPAKVTCKLCLRKIEPNVKKVEA